MELKPGYKQTEVGVIPEDWQVDPLGRHASFRTGPFGSALHQSDYVSDAVPVVNPMHIVNGRIEPTPDMTISEFTAQQLVDFRLRADEIVIGRRGDMGRCAVVEPDQVGWLCGTGSMIVRPVNFHPRFLQRVLSSRRVVNAIAERSVGTTMVNLNQNVLASLRIQHPEIVEQSAIATVLDDTDELLKSLNAILTKKRNLKQAAMQQLLTGQTRLPGFGGVWKVRSLGRHLTFLRNGTNSRAELVNQGTTKYLHYGDIHGSNEVVWNIASKEMPYLPSTMSQGLDQLEDGDVIFADASEDMTGVGKSVEVFGLGNQEAVSGLHTIAVRFDKSVLADGFKSYLQFMPPFRHHLQRLVAGTKVYSTNRAHISTCEIALPRIDEQVAITQVLSAIDEELAAIEARREKTRLLKLGMMQELLTGKTRLAPHA